MEYTQTFTKNLIIGLSGVLLTVATFFGFYYNKMEKVQTDKNSITLTADSLMAVKNTMHEELLSLTDKLSTEKTQTDELEATLATKEKEINSKSYILRDVKSKLVAMENVNNIKVNAIATLENQINELKGIRTTLEKTFIEAKEHLLALETENKTLKDNNLALENRLKMAEEDMTKVKYLATADNFKVEVLKPNSKVTAKAKKARVINISMKMPSFLKSKEADSKPIYMTLTDEKNNPIIGWDKEVKVKDEFNKDLSIAVHKSQMIDFSKNPQKVSFNYTVENKLKPGIYTAKVYTTDSYLGTVEFKVTDSFWFF